MTVTSVSKNTDALTMTITAAFDVSVERVWQLWADPRQLERWWGPPTYPATVIDHDLSPGGTVSYFMTSPEGEKYAGWWRIVAVDAPRRLEFVDGFSDDAGNPNPDMPTTKTVVTVADGAGGVTTMTIDATFASREAMDQLITMGMEEGMIAAMGQIDAILAG
jgi:uncharacterized protein YndB with AHSA1/START domain